MINNEGLLNTCCPTKCELIYVYNFKVENRKYKGYKTGSALFQNRLARIISGDFSLICGRSKQDLIMAVLIEVPIARW